MQKKLFVSHSSRTSENEALLQAVCNGLSAQGFDVLVDKGGRIYAGDDWDLRLNEWMAECHAAVILFSTAALKDSLWVAKEAAILSWRRELERDGDFKLIPVLLGDISPEALEEGLYGVLRISQSQCIRRVSEAQQIEAQQIVDEVAVSVGPSAGCPATPFERLEGVLAKMLEAQADAATLEDAWENLDGENKPGWQPDSGLRFASALTRFMLRDRLRATANLQTLLDRIRPRVGKDAAEELLKYLACLWVDAEAAGGIAKAANSGGILGLNGNYLHDFTAKRYGERAWPLSDRLRFIPVDSSKRDPDAITDVIREEFRPRGMPIPDDRVDQRIKGCSDPVVVLIPASAANPQLPDSGLLEDLQGRFPNLIYLFGTGEGEPDFVPDGMALLKPLLDIEVEEDQLFMLNDVQNFIDDRLHGSL